MATRRVSCGSVEAALQSVAACVDLATDDLRARLRAVDGDAIAPQASNAWRDAHENVFRAALGTGPDDFEPVDEVLWFHATRAPRGTSFSEGLLPTHLAIRQLETRIAAIAKDVSEVGPPCIDDGAPSRLQLKQMGGAAAGPFGFLLREAALVPHGRDFLRRAPEAVEELAYVHSRERSRAIVEAYVAQTSPCLVWFTTVDGLASALSRAAYYAYLKLRGDSVSSANTNYCGRGAVISADRIVRVEFPD